METIVYHVRAHRWRPQGNYRVHYRKGIGGTGETLCGAPITANDAEYRDIKATIKRGKASELCFDWNDTHKAICSNCLARMN